jgi:hypothetical protein
MAERSNSALTGFAAVLAGSLVLTWLLTGGATPQDWGSSRYDRVIEDGVQVALPIAIALGLVAPWEPPWRRTYLGPDGSVIFRRVLGFCALPVVIGMALVCVVSWVQDLSGLMRGG